MTLLISAFGFAGRIAGDLLTTALGWASSLLFGRVPRSHQVFLVLMMALSFLWLVLLIALLVPTLASFLLAATPHPASVNEAGVGLALLVGVLVLPLGVGFAGYLVPAEGRRAGGISFIGELARGYVLAPLVSGLLIFLAAVGIVRKVRSRRHGWSDVHVAIVVKPHGYDQVVADLAEALEEAGLPVTVGDAPWVLTLPARLLTAVSGDNIRKLRPDRLVELGAPTLRIGVYPSDIAISGTTRDRVRARAALLSRLTTTAVYLTTSAEAQKVEDAIAKLATPRPARSAGTIHDAFGPIDESLIALAVPTDEWDTLYRLRLQVERDLVIGVRPGTEFPSEKAG